MKRCFFVLVSLMAAVCYFGLQSCGSADAKVDTALIDSLLNDVTSNRWDAHLDSAPDYGCIKLKLRHIGPLKKAFRDSNYLHVESGEALGCGVISDINDAWYLKNPLVEIRSCEDYYVDNLTHSYPYLVPEAAELLGEIGRRFRDELEAQGGGDYRIKVTSVLRTPMTVKRLRRVNRNATDASAHQYGTTFDISYSKFICDSNSVGRTFEDLKNILGQILYDLREDGRCYVVFERKQSCFHITVRS